MADIWKLTLELSEPLEITTDGLGRILVSHWSIGAVQKIVKRFKTEFESSSDFIRAFIKELGRFPGNGQNLHEEFESGRPIDGAENLTEDDLSAFSRAYVEKFRHEILSWVTYSEDDTDPKEEEKKEGEPDKDFFCRLIETSVRRQQEKSKKLRESFGLIGATSGLFDHYSKNQARIGVLGAKIRDLQSASIAETPSRPFIHELPENPTYKTNELLESHARKLDLVKELLKTQAEQAVLLNEQTELLLQDAAKSSRQTKIGIWVAAIGILVGASISCYSVFQSATNDAETSILFQNNLDENTRSNEIQREFLRELRSIAVELKNFRQEGVANNDEVQTAPASIPNREESGSK